MTSATTNVFGQCRGGVRFETTRLGVYANAFLYRTALDFDGDGDIDFAGNTDTVSQPTNNVGILLNNGSGGLTLRVLSANNGTFGGFFGGTWADFNADGRPDFLGNYSTAPFRVIFYNDGNGGLTFGRPLDFATSSEYISTFGEVNGDGREDFITTGPVAPGTDEPTYNLYLSNGNGTYDAPIYLGSRHGGHFIGDFNGDGRKDVAIRRDVSNTQNYTLKYMLQNAGGSFNETPEINMGRFRLEGVKEFNHDGIDDFYGTTSFSTTVSVYISHAGGAHTAADFPAAYKDGTYRLYFADFNGDGNVDIVDSGRAVNATFGYTAMFGNGSGNFRIFSNPAPLDDQGVKQIGQPVDFTGDGLADIVKFTADLAGQTTVDLLTTVCQPLGQTKTIDFDGDGKTDLAMWDAATGKWSVKLSSNGATRSTNWGRGDLGDTPAAGDFDGDGKTDHAIYRDSTGDWYILRSSDGAVTITHFGLSGDRPAVADFDGDGKSDVAVFRPSDGNWYILGSQNGVARGLHFGATGDVPVQSDFDGDGKADVAVYRPSEGNWYYLRSSNNQFAAIHWGIATDRPVAADYDGDGKSDIAIYRPSEGNWYILRSATGAFAVTRWGLAGDTPAAFDTDGDATFEVGVYRGGNNNWYVNPSMFVQFGTAGEVPVSIN